MVLPASAYTSQEQFNLEVERLFKPGWHCIGTVQDLPRIGGYFTFNLFGTPLIVWRTDENIRSFLNVCPHRFSILTKEKCGNADSFLKCPNHGWKFDKTGRVCHIPDAKSFIPMKNNFSLKKYQNQLCGSLIFITLSKDPIPLREFLGPGFELAQKLFSDPYNLIGTVDCHVDVNWKVKVENTVEEYHLETVHAKTFGKYTAKIPEEEICWNTLEENWTCFATTQQISGKLFRSAMALARRIMGIEREKKYEHFIFYPNITFGTLQTFPWVEMIFPVSPRKTQVLVKLFQRSPTRRNPISLMVSSILSFFHKKSAKLISAEDNAILPGIQQGIETAEHPSKGIISRREERVAHFQKYIQAHTASDWRLIKNGDGYEKAAAHIDNGRD
jgi:phenylpropionate dioxygenase-like ring-hydroxylating dioxygenase large terminal subunit